jgi:hypothetical protein
MTEPAGPTRYVTPEEFNVGTHFVGGCPRCDGQGSSWLARHFRKGSLLVGSAWYCRFCRGWGTALYVKQPDGTFKPQRVPREPI